MNAGEVDSERGFLVSHERIPWRRAAPFAFGGSVDHFAAAVDAIAAGIIFGIGGLAGTGSTGTSPSRARCCGFFGESIDERRLADGGDEHVALQKEIGDR